MIDKYKQMLGKMNSANINNWNDIDNFLAEIKISKVSSNFDSVKDEIEKGIAFLTFDYGIDGVSIEISKYASCFENLVKRKKSLEYSVPLHFIGGDFYPNAEAVLKPHWNRFKVEGINGWSKWFDGKYFSKLYYEDMPENSSISKEMAKEMWSQAVDFVTKIGEYLTDNNVKMIFPVNIFSNPGNFALSLAGIIVSEMLELYVFNSNHDFYWEGGMPKELRGDEPAGPRDHFFKNYHNSSFFSLFKKMYPWNGELWAQVNINTQQCEVLHEKFNFPKHKLFELSTTVSDEFFREFSKDEVLNNRLTMAHILSDGMPIVKPIPIDEHLEHLTDWMHNQKPIVCALNDKTSLDLTDDNLIYCLQPTRVISRKRIEKDLELFAALFDFDEFKNKFIDNPDMKIILHITGPVPIEHQNDTEVLLKAFQNLVQTLPLNFAERVFIAFSVGTEDHPSLKKANLKRLHIEDIYRLADIILFPSETEGRGLPIVESGACGIPIVCSRYYPEEVFAEVVGEHLSEEKQIQYILFPEEGFPDDMLKSVTDVVFNPEIDYISNMIKHNKKAVYERYGMGGLINTFNEVMISFEHH